MHPSPTKSLDWQYACTVPMFLATLAVLFGSLPALQAPGSGGDWGLGNLFNWLAWPYGLLGVALCYVEEAAFRKPLALATLAWSAATLLWSAMTGEAAQAGPDQVYPFGPGGNMVFLGGCLTAAFLVVLYDCRKDWLPDAATRAVSWLARALIGLWAALPWAVVALIALR